MSEIEMDLVWLACELFVIAAIFVYIYCIDKPNCKLTKNK